MQKKVLITSALLYANGSLHLGHLAGAYLPADIFARFSRFIGDDVHFISGSDEYGVAITLAAEKEKKTPKAYVDHFHKVNKALFEALDFSFDHYSRTTCKGHSELVQDFFIQLDKNGYIEKTKTKQLFSEKENRFLADRYVVG
nr:Methionine--tRNA ligase [Chlamydiota bacterium]